jgi:hypothetical protein
MSISTPPPEYKESEAKRDAPGEPGTKKTGPRRGPSCDAAFG